jgi:hypothetical protein
LKFPVLVGIFGGIIVGFLQFLSITQGEGNFGAVLFYSPLILFFAVIYMSIKKTRDKDPGAFSFKTGLKAGGITATIMSLFLGIGVFIALTQTDVHGLVKYLIDIGKRDQIKETLSEITRQKMFDRAKFFAIPFFLLGFFITLAVTMIFSKRNRT